ncbi:Fe-S cluster assembly protein IscX [Candidatus Methylomirabilis sp.]|uniref:Fe-S cluster assembly protein IscX n=1 Tax=Candidatus Methylomirabilis sp. TaxID=2032687 RepID=UPI00307632AD
MSLFWDDTYEIAEALIQSHPEQDPLEVPFTTLHKWITELPDFDDDPNGFSEAKLEAVQMAWYEEATG